MNSENDDPRPPWRLTLHEVGALLILVALGTALRVAAAAKPLSGDEITMYLFVIRGGLADFFAPWDTSTSHFELDISNHPLNALLTIASVNFFERTTIWTLRLPSLLAGIATIPMAYWAVRDLARSRRAGLLAALGLALATGPIQYAALSRGYAFLMFFEIGAVWAFVRFLTRPTWTSALFFVMTGCLAIYSHLVGMAILGSLAVAAAVFYFLRMARSRLSRKKEALQFIKTIGIFIAVLAGSALLYSPYLSIVDILRSLLTEGQLPPDSFGRMPGVPGGEDAGRTFSTWREVAEQVLGWRAPMAWLVIAAWSAGGIVLMRRRLESGLAVIGLSAIPVAVGLAAGVSIEGRFFIFLAPPFMVSLAVLFDILADRIAARGMGWRRWAANAFAAAAIMAIVLPASASYLKDPHPKRAGPWRLDEAEQFIHEKASDDDLVFLFPVGPMMLALDTSGYVQPYGLFHAIGGFGKRGYAGIPHDAYTVYYISPKPPELEAAYLPAGFDPKPAAEFARTTVYRGRVSTPTMHVLDLNGDWRQYVEHGRPLTMGISTESDGVSFSIRVETDGTNALVRSVSVPVVPGRLVRLAARVEAGPRYLSLSPLYAGLTFYRSDESVIEEPLTSAWQDVEHPPGSGQHTLRLSRVVPEDATHLRVSLRIVPVSRRDDWYKIRSLRVFGDWPE